MFNSSNKNRSECALACATILAERGTPVFPCLENKAPACERGFLAATTDIKILKRLWNNSAVLVGVPTGEVSGIDVLDIDPRHGGNIWLAENQHRIPNTFIQGTRSGGSHLIFNHHNGLRNSAGKIADGVDVRADGGYIICWAAASIPALNYAAPADWPEWLLELAMPKPVEIKRVYYMAPINGSVYAHAALRHAAKKVATAPKGTRNDTLNREMFSMRRFINSGELDIHDVTATLLSAALSAGLCAKEAAATIVSALRAKKGAA